MRDLQEATDFLAWMALDVSAQAVQAVHLAPEASDGHRRQLQIDGVNQSNSLGFDLMRPEDAESSSDSSLDSETVRARLQPLDAQAITIVSHPRATTAPGHSSRPAGLVDGGVGDDDGGGVSATAVVLVVGMALVAASAVLGVNGHLQPGNGEAKPNGMPVRTPNHFLATFGFFATPHLQLYLLSWWLWTVLLAAAEAAAAEEEQQQQQRTTLSAAV